MGSSPGIKREHWCAQLERIQGILLPLSCALVALVYAPSLSDYMVAKRASMHAITALVVGLWLARGVLAGRLSVPVVPWLWPACAYWVVSLLSLTQASNVQQGIEVLLTQGGLLALALATAEHYRGRIPWPLLASITGTALVVAIIGVLQYADIHLIPTPHVRFGNLGISTLGNPNFVAHYLEIAILLTLGLMVICRALWLRGLLVSVLLFLCYYMLLTQSRGGWLALACGLFFFFWRIGRSALRQTPWSAVIIAVLLIGVVAEFGLRATTGHDGNENPYGGLWGFVERVGSRAASAVNMQHISIVQRRLIWADTIELIKNEPLLGVGVGNYEFALPAYRTASRHREWQQYIGDLPHMPYYAHNEYLEIWAESGVLALLLWLLTLIVIVRTSWQTALGREDSEGRIMAWALLAAIVAVLVHAVFSLNLQEPVSALHFWIVVGAMGALCRARTWTWSLSVWGRGIAGMGALVVILGGSYLCFSIILGDYYYFQGQKKYYDHRQFNRAFLFYDKAAEWRPSEFRHQHMLGLAALQTRHMGKAEVALRNCIYLHPNNAAALRLLGETLYWRNKATEGIPILQRAVALDPLHADTYAWLSRSLQRRGREGGETQRATQEKAIDTWRQALAFAPENAEYLRGLGLAYSEARQLDKAVSVFEQALSIHPGDGVALGNLGAIYLRQGKVDEAEVVLKKAAAVEPERAEWWGNLGLLYNQRGDLEKASEAMRQAAVHDPADLRWHLHLAEILMRRQKAEQALEAVMIALEHHPQNEVLTKLVQDILRRAQKGE